MKNAMSMGQLGDKFTQAVSIRTYEFLKDLDFEQIKELMQEQAEFISEITNQICDHTSVSEQYEEDAKDYKCMVDFLLNVGEETTLHNMMFDALEDGVKKLSKDIANLL
jgi:hypothetical protein